MKYLTILTALILTSCEEPIECIHCTYPTGEVEEFCSDRLSYPEIQLPILEEELTRNGWDCHMLTK